MTWHFYSFTKHITCLEKLKLVCLFGFGGLSQFLLTSKVTQKLSSRYLKPELCLNPRSSWYDRLLKKSFSVKLDRYLLFFLSSAWILVMFSNLRLPVGVVPTAFEELLRRQHFCLKVQKNISTHLCCGSSRRIFIIFCHVNLS